MLHMATQQPSRVEAMVLLAPGSYFGQHARAMMRELTPDNDFWDWDLLREEHVRGDDQILALINQCEDFADT